MWVGFGFSVSAENGMSVFGASVAKVTVNGLSLPLELQWR